MKHFNSKFDAWPIQGIIALHINQHKDAFNYPSNEIHDALRQWLIDPKFALDYVECMVSLIKGESKPLAALYVLFNNIELTYGIETLKQYANDIWHINVNRKAA